MTVLYVKLSEHKVWKPYNGYFHVWAEGSKTLPRLFYVLKISVQGLIEQS